MKDIREKLKDILGEKYFIFGECMIDSLIRIDEIGTVFCPLMMKRDLEFRVK